MKKYSPQPPVIHPVREIAFPPIAGVVLPNGLPCYHVNMGTQDLIRIEFVCWGGRPYERHPLVSRATAALMKEGTLHHSGGEIAEHFDYYGAGLDASFQVDTGNLAMYCLNKQLPDILPLFIEVLCEPAFSETDLRAYTRRKQQELKEDLSKTEVVAYRHITACFYGDQHPYGYNSDMDAYDKLQRDWLIEHHQRCFHAGNGFVLISGRFDDAVLQLAHEHLARIPGGVPAQPVDMTRASTQPGRIHLPHGQAIQSAIRMGLPLFPRTHPDANGVQVLVTLLGGYFGSRLMENIREDKGYTYNITASYDTMLFDGALLIDTEVSPEYVAPTLAEIHKELHRLMHEPVAEAELDMVKNYLMGSFLAMVDGPFNWAETVRTLLVERSAPQTLEQLVHDVLHITPHDLQVLAQRYLDPTTWWTVVAGGDGI